MSIDESVRYLRLMLGGMKYAVKYWADKDKEESDIEQTNIEAVTTALDIMRNYQMMQADYNARLKDDMVAMLTEIQVGIGEHINPSNHTDSYEDGWSEGAEWCVDYIQEKINNLKGDL